MTLAMTKTNKLSEKSANSENLSRREFSNLATGNSSEIGNYDLDMSIMACSA